MSTSQEHHAVIVQPTPILNYPNSYGSEVLHWDGTFFALLCFGSWVMFAYLWARLHLSKPPALPPPLPPLKRPPPSKVEHWMSSEHWRN